MGAFDRCQATGDRGLRDVEAFVGSRAVDGRFVTTDKGTMSRLLQREVGDFLANGPDGRCWGLELKTEEADRHGNFFLETWSNLNFGMQTVGWMLTLKCDVLLYYFLESRELYSIDFRRLFEWAWGTHGRPPQLHARNFRFKAQKKHSQLNETWGYCVPISKLGAQVGYKKFVPGEGPGGFVEGERVRPTRQEELFPYNGA
jgi:hypothetical protein